MKINALKTLGLAQLKAGDLTAARANTEQALAITTANNMLAQHWQLLLQQSLGSGTEDITQWAKFL